MVIADASGLPLAVHTASASPHEVTLVQATLDETVTVGRPRRIVGDRAYDSDPLDKALAAQGIELIAPHRRNRKRKATQDGRPLRRYSRRWRIERLFAWLNKFKRTMVRWDHCYERFTAFVYLACSMILIRKLCLGNYEMSSSDCWQEPTKAMRLPCDFLKKVNDFIILLAWHSRGRGFDSLQVHQNECQEVTEKSVTPFSFEKSTSANRVCWLRCWNLPQNLFQLFSSILMRN